MEQTNRNTTEQIFQEIMLYFSGDREKVKLWIETPNPQLGGVSPQEMMLMGRHERLLKFILSCKAQTISEM